MATKIYSNNNFKIYFYKKKKNRNWQNKNL